MAKSASLKPVLDRLYADFNSPDSATDPIQIVRRYQRPDDREVVALLAASLAFGRVASVLQSIGEFAGECIGIGELRGG